MNPIECFGAIVVACGLMFILGYCVLVIIDQFDGASESELRSVGIHHIERCHNTYSNWYEIVWIKDVKENNDRQ